MKNLLASKTFWTIICTVTVAVTPKIGQMIESKKFSASDFLAVAGIAAGAGLTIISAYKENDKFYTPHGLPGRNKND